MSSVSAALGAQAAPVTVEWNGRTIELRPAEWGRVFSALEQWLIEREADPLVASWERLVARGLMTRAELIAKNDEFTTRATESGEYSFGGPKQTKILQAIFAVLQAPAAPEGGDASKAPAPEAIDHATAAGVLKFVSLLIGVDMQLPEVMAFLRDKRQELGYKLPLVLKRSLPDPKEPPATPAA